MHGPAFVASVIWSLSVSFTVPAASTLSCEDDVVELLHMRQVRIDASSNSTQREDAGQDQVDAVRDAVRAATLSATTPDALPLLASLGTSKRPEADEQLLCPGQVGPPIDNVRRAGEFVRAGGA
ncbi:hypothetical protein AK812_SmicGene41812 [Symbiodinium microadriaticum]|uniref:Secreted protein n=1 Tax=Symbiodinium microadriaticum TaxID=2951 RepID=A0A1Q9C556_SYMMI|nr:hypothetical protein AK812_SmicGene41812 [Symbiodinium microadriaticum]